MTATIQAQELTKGRVFRIRDDRRDFLRMVHSIRAYREHGDLYVLVEWTRPDEFQVAGALTLVAHMLVDVVEQLDPDEAMNEVADLINTSEDGDVIRIFNVNGRFYA